MADRKRYPECLPDQLPPDPASRLSAEWISVAAFRGLTKIATNGAINSTYESALEFGGALYPELLGPETSILRRYHESDIAKEYRQKARLRSIRDKTVVQPGDLINSDIDELKGLIHIAENQIGDTQRTRADQLKNRLARLVAAEKELNPVPHTENQLIFRDAYVARQDLPTIDSGHGYRDFRLPDTNVLRVRVFHPDVPEHITGADIIYERHSPSQRMASLVAVQYKIWEDKTLYLSDNRMTRQLARLKAFLCDNGACTQAQPNSAYRFPFCAAFIKPTDKLQRPDQKLLSSGEHLPICQIGQCKTRSRNGAMVLEYEKIREISLNSMIFEILLNRGKIGSRMIPYPELTNLYSDHIPTLSEDNVVIHAQEFPDQPDEGEPF